jgi:hypothetical protein
MIDRAGQTVTTDLVVTVGADVATWAAQCGATTVEEAARRLSDAVDLDTLAECLGQLNTLPDGVTVDAEQQSVRGTLQTLETTPIDAVSCREPCHGRSEQPVGQGLRH